MVYENVINYKYNIHKTYSIKPITLDFSKYEYRQLQKQPFTTEILLTPHFTSICRVRPLKTVFVKEESIV